MSLFFPDTSTLISLLDEEEPFHDKAREIMREYRIADIFVPMSVQAEWQSRVMREHRKMVTGIIRLIDKKRSENIMEMTSAEFNVIADTAAREIKGNWIRSGVTCKRKWLIFTDPHRVSLFQSASRLK